MPFELDLSAAAGRLARVRSLFGAAAVDDILLAAGRRVGVAAESLISAYPPQSNKILARYYTRMRPDGTTYQSKFKSLAQQRAIFALMQKGKVPYRRTGQLGRSLISRAERAGNGLVVIQIGSNLTYAPLVIDQWRQSHYHRGTWTPLQTDLRRGLSQLQRVAVDEAVQHAERRLKGG